MSNTTVSDSVARPVRTVTQGSAAWVVTEGIDAFLYNMDNRQYGVMIVGLTMLFSFIQSVTENYLGRAVLRKIEPSSTPVVDSE